MRTSKKIHVNVFINTSENFNITLGDLKIYYNITQGGLPNLLQYYIGGGLANLLQYYIGGEGSSETPKSYYVIYGLPLKYDKPTDSPGQVLEILQHLKNHDFCQVSRKWESTTRLTLTLCSSRSTHAFASGKRSVSSSSMFLPDKNLSQCAEQVNSNFFTSGLS